MPLHHFCLPLLYFLPPLSSFPGRVDSVILLGCVYHVTTTVLIEDQFMGDNQSLDLSSERRLTDN